MDIIKDKNGMDLKEAEDIKKRWQEYTEEQYEKDLHDPDNHDSVITHTVRHPGMGSQLGLSKTKLVEVMEFQLSSFKS